MEFDALADLEGVGLATVGRLRHCRAQIADEVGGRGRVVRVDPDQYAVKRRHRVQSRKGALAMTVEARRCVRWDRVGEGPAAFPRLFLRRRGRRWGGDED